MRLLSRVLSGLAVLRPREFGLVVGTCPFCGPTAFVRLNATQFGVRCVRCAATPVHLALSLALRESVTDLSMCDVCELSARGPLVDYLRRSARSVSVSEYFEDVPGGRLRDGIRCEDIQRLTYADASFDLVTHTEVLEHVPDDARAFSELLRVLRPGGATVFSVPMHEGEHTVERARLRDGVLEYLQPPVYHADPLHDGAGILAFRDYGRDILARLYAAGFAKAALRTPARTIPWTAPRAVVVAHKPV